MQCIGAQDETGVQMWDYNYCTAKKFYIDRCYYLIKFHKKIVGFSVYIVWYANLFWHPFIYSLFIFSPHRSISNLNCKWSKYVLVFYTSLYQNYSKGIEVQTFIMWLCWSNTVILLFVDCKLTLGYFWLGKLLPCVNSFTW